MASVASAVPATSARTPIAMRRRPARVSRMGTCLRRGDGLAGAARRGDAEGRVSERNQQHHAGQLSGIPNRDPPGHWTDNPGDG